MRESLMRKRVVKALAAFDARPIDGVTTDQGVPDVECLLGWIELKHLPRFPARAGTPVRVPHFTREQRGWLRRRWRAGGHAYLLLGVGTRDDKTAQWFLFQGDVAADRLGDMDRMELAAGCIAWWPNGLHDEVLVTVLDRCHKNRP